MSSPRSPRARAPPQLTRRVVFGLGAGVGAAVLLGGCGSDSATTTGAGPGASAAAGPVTVRSCVYAKNHASSALYWQQFAPAGYTIEVTPVMLDPVLNALRA